ncbi:MAG: hypothetical protein ACKOGN_08215, partial [Gammaproteobacteria bacterium]
MGIEPTFVEPIPYLIRQFVVDHGAVLKTSSAPSNKTTQDPSLENLRSVQNVTTFGFFGVFENGALTLKVRLARLSLASADFRISKNFCASAGVRRSTWVGTETEPRMKPKE